MSLLATVPAPASLGRIGAILGALAGAVGVRVILERSAAAGFAAGAVFGIMLLAAAIAEGWRIERVTVIGVAGGLLGGAVLVAIPRLLDPATAGFVGIQPEAWMLWLAVTILVSWSEEILLRGALFDAVRTPAGPLAAIIVTALAFALIHVPLYGWSVVPLDLAVGVWLGGLRLASGGVVAPALAHMVADLATW